MILVRFVGSLSQCSVSEKYTIVSFALALFAVREPGEPQCGFGVCVTPRDFPSWPFNAILQTTGLCLLPCHIPDPKEALEVFKA